MKPRELISIYKPFLKPYTKSAIKAIESEWISNHGENVGLAVSKLQKIIDSKYIILMSNGTVATHCLFIALKFKHPNVKTIYVPNNVYVAAYNTALMEFLNDDLEILKIDPLTWNMCTDQEYLLPLKPNSCIFVVHNLGNIVNVDRINRIRPDIILIEDNCEGIFGKYNEIYSGTSNSVLCSSLSFYGNKTITTGEGGAFLTQNSDVYKYINKVYSQGMSSIKYVHDVHAYNYRMTNIQAGFLLDQLNDISTILNNKQRIFNNYDTLFQNMIFNNKVNIQKSENNTCRANWIYPLRILNNKFSIQETNEFFLSHNVEIRPFFYPFCEHNHLKSLKCESENLQNSYLLNREIILIPSSPNLSFEEQKYIAKVIEKFVLRNDLNMIMINQSNINILDTFLKNELSPHFRYYKNRGIEASKSHLFTMIIEYDQKYVGYGHIDKEENKYWIGLCVLDKFHGLGIGRFIMENLITIAKVEKVQNLNLSVDSNNTIAIQLYKQMGFTIQSILNNKIFMVLII